MLGASCKYCLGRKFYLESSPLCLLTILTTWESAPIMHTYYTYHMGISSNYAFLLYLPYGRLEIGPLTWGALCQWSEKIELLIP